MNEKNNEKTANRLKQLREKTGLNQSQLAKKIGISEQSISKYERGERKPKIDKLEALADFYGVTVSYIKGDSTQNRLKLLRNQLGLTLDDIEEKTGINRGTYNNYESGKTEPSLKTWKKLADFFGTTVSYLQGEDTVLKARDLFFEISILADLYPGLHEQLKAIEDHYGIEYGYEALKKDWSYSNDTL